VIPRIVAAAFLAAVAAGCQVGGSGDDDVTVAERDLTRPGTLRICADASRPPMVYRGSDGVLRGFEVDLLGEIARMFELEPVWIETTHSALIDALAEGRCDLIASALTVRPAYQERIAEFAYLTAPVSVLVRDEEAATFALGLCGRRVGALAGTREEEIAGRYSEECVRRGDPPIEAVVATSTDEALSRLRAGRTDAFLDDRPITEWYSRRQTDRFDDGGTLPSEENVVYAIGYGIAKNSIFLGLQGALLTLNRDGSLAELMHRWGLENAGVRPLRLA
jgi:polar amino acid transport system substrate-binding protein